MSKSPIELSSRFVRLAVAASAGLAASCCSSYVPTPAADYCSAQHRTISSSERIVSALIYVQEHHQEGLIPPFASFQHSMSKKLTSYRGIAAAYLNRFPECCEVVLPWVVTDYYKNSDFGRNEALEIFAAENKAFEWSNDVVIHKFDRGNERANDLKDEPKPYRIQSSSCGKAKRLRMG